MGEFSAGCVTPWLPGDPVVSGFPNSIPFFPRKSLCPGILLRHLQPPVAEPAPGLFLQPAVDADESQRRGSDPGLSPGNSPGETGITRAGRASGASWALGHLLGL